MQYCYSLCADIDECSRGEHECSQICNNTLGGHFCSCENGYQLQNDGITCEGTISIEIKQCSTIIVLLQILMSALKAMILVLETLCVSISMDHLTVFVHRDFSFKTGPVRVMP